MLSSHSAATSGTGWPVTSLYLVVVSCRFSAVLEVEPYKISPNPTRIISTANGGRNCATKDVMSGGIWQVHTY